MSKAEQIIASPQLLNFLDLWGFSKDKRFIWVVIGITALMVVLEAKYNIDLLGALSDPSVESSAASDLSQRGKLLAAFGITWALARGLLTKIRPFALGLLAFVSLSIGAYFCLDYTYTKVIAGLDPEIKVMGFNLFSYRRDLLTGKLIDPDIPLPKNEPIFGKIFMGAFPMVMLDDRFMLPAQDILERKADDKRKEVLLLAEKKWLEYSGNMRKLAIAHEKFIVGSQKASGTASFEKDWSEYDTNMKNLAGAHQRFTDTSKLALGLTSPEKEWSSYNANMNSLSEAYKRFIEGSNKALRYGNRGVQEFRRQSEGLEPNPNLSKAQFVSMLKGSSHPKGAELRRAENRQIGKRPDGSAIYAREIPYFLSRTEFVRWVSTQARENIRLSGFEPDASLSRTQFIEKLRHTKGTGDDLLKAESREIGKWKNGEPVYVRDMPYFMSRDDFARWTSALAKETMIANGFEPNVDLTRDQFVSMLRASKSKDGESFRAAEKTEIGKRPDGTVIYARDVPYFMNHNDYTQWVASQADAAKSMVMPTVENVENFARIQEVNSAVFLPPMAIISSLTSAMTNGISLVLILFGMFFTLLKPTNGLGMFLKKYTAPLMVFIFAGLLYLMPSHVFLKTMPIYELETQFHDRVGWAGVLWSKLSNVQKFIL